MVDHQRSQTHPNAMRAGCKIAVIWLPVNQSLRTTTKPGEAALRCAPIYQLALGGLLPEFARRTCRSDALR
jgi:hypothetical protein